VTRRVEIALPIALISLVLASLAAICIGQYTLSPRSVAQVVLHALHLMPAASDPYAATVILDARLPRVIAAILVGAALSLAGGSYQAVFRNPLVSPGLLGVLAGAGFGAAVAILLGWPPALRMVASFAGGLAAVGTGIAIASLFGRGEEGSILLLVFGGLVSTALFTALLSMVKFVADPANALADIVFWLLGSLASVSRDQIRQVAPLLAIGIAALLYCGRFLDVLTLSDDEARSLGVPAHGLRIAIIVAATITCALTVALVGTIGWVGLVVPHIARLIVGPANRRLLPVAACLGGIFMLLSDTLARSLTASEIPIGIVTDLIGVIAFLLVLPRMRRAWI
jgi:iron complex transport system permease protein